MENLEIAFEVSSNSLEYKNMNSRLFWRLFMGLVIVHSAELFISLKIGKEKGLSVQTTVTKTLLYGFTW